jgi:hypothetical protein
MRRHGKPAATSAATLFVGCPNSKPRYFPVLYVNGIKKKYPKAAARPGDKVVLSVRENSRRAVVSVVDKTRLGVSRKLTGSGASLFGRTWIGDLSWPWPGDFQWGVPNFGTLRFSKSKRFGRPFATYHPAGFEPGAAYGDPLQIKISRFSREGESFKTIFKNF